MTSQDQPVAAASESHPSALVPTAPEELDRRLVERMLSDRDTRGAGFAESFEGWMAGLSVASEAQATRRALQARDLPALFEIWLSTLSPEHRADFKRVMRQAANDLRIQRDAEMFAAHECLAHPDCGPVTALGSSGHGHHSDATGLWCWHFTDRFLGGGPLDPPPPDGSDAAKRRAHCCIDGDPAIHKTYPTAGPREGYWFDDAAIEAGLTRKASIVERHGQSHVAAHPGY